MKAYMIMSSKTVEPFCDHPRDCLIANQKLSSLQEHVLQSLGLGLESVSDFSEINDPEEHIVFSDSLYFNRELLTTFISVSQKRKQRTLCCLNRGLTALRTVSATQDVKRNEDFVEYGLHYIPGGSPTGEPLPVAMVLSFAIQFYTRVCSS